MSDERKIATAMISMAAFMMVSTAGFLAYDSARGYYRTAQAAEKIAAEQPLSAVNGGTGATVGWKESVQPDPRQLPTLDANGNIQPPKSRIDTSLPKTMPEVTTASGLLDSSGVTASSSGSALIATGSLTTVRATVIPENGKWDVSGAELNELLTAVLEAISGKRTEIMYLGLVKIVNDRHAHFYEQSIAHREEDIARLQAVLERWQKRVAEVAP
jgi:hypothetical protein